MADADNLQARIDAEFAASAQKLKDFKAEAVQAYEDRQTRLKLFEKVCGQLQHIWRPRLEMLAAKFSGHVKTTPKLTPELRQVTFDFDSQLASVQLRISASTDSDVRKLVLDYNLDILPILMAFDRHVQADFPLEAIDAAAIGQWIDDRIVQFVQTYLSMSQNEFYLKDHMVTDPVTGVRFPKYAAAATIERKGQTLYFIAEKTRSEYEKKESQAAGS